MVYVYVRHQISTQLCCWHQSNFYTAGLFVINYTLTLHLLQLPAIYILQLLAHNGVNIWVCVLLHVYIVGKYLG